MNGREDFKSFRTFLDEDEVKSRSIRSQRIAGIYIYIYIFEFLFFPMVVLIKASNKR